MILKSLRKKSKGAVNTPVIFIILILGLAILLTTAFSFRNSPNPNPGQTFTPENPTPGDGKKNLQLNTLNFKKNEVKTGNTCAGSKFNEEPDIFVGSDPPQNGIATANGRIRVWIDDGNGGSISQGEVIDPSTGAIVTAGDRNATDRKGPNYYRWEPALYITPISSAGQAGPFVGDAENGGRAYYPQFVRGRVVNVGSSRGRGYLTIPPVESPVGFDTRTRRGHGGNMAQFTWEVNSLGLAPGLYRAQFVIHDGDGDIAINCTTIQI